MSFRIPSIYLFLPPSLPPAAAEKNQICTPATCKKKEKKRKKYNTPVNGKEKR